MLNNSEGTVGDKTGDGSMSPVLRLYSAACHPSESRISEIYVTAGQTPKVKTSGYPQKGFSLINNDLCVEIHPARRDRSRKMPHRRRWGIYFC